MAGRRHSRRHRLDVVGALGPGAGPKHRERGPGFGEFGHGGRLFVVVGKKCCDVRHQVVVAAGIRADDHVAIVVAVQIGDLAQQGDGVIAGG